jgi:hypothetical protein
MDVGLFSPRANVPVQAGPAGLGSWCVVTTSPVGVLLKPAGTTAYHVDGVHTWLNVDGTVAGWIAGSALGAVAALAPYVAALQAVAIRELAGVPGQALGVAVTSFDVALPGGADASGGFRFVVQGFSSGAGVADVRLRVNASTANLHRTGQYTLSDQSPPNNYFGDTSPDLGRYNFAAGAAGSGWMVDVDCPAARSGQQRMMRARFTGCFDAAADRYWPNWTEKSWILSAPDIASVGIETSVALDIAASSRFALWRYPTL